MKLRLSFALAVIFACFALGACARRGDPTVALAMDGPPLFVIGEYKGINFEGSLERTAMAGVGLISLKAAGEEPELVCESKFNSQPTPKGRVPGFIDCGKAGILAVMLRNLGPDQGVGIAHAGDTKELMIFFYHASREEAERRLPGVVKDIREVQEKRES